MQSLFLLSTLEISQTIVLFINCVNLKKKKKKKKKIIPNEQPLYLNTLQENKRERKDVNPKVTKSHKYFTFS